MHGTGVDLQRSLVAERLVAPLAQDALLHFAAAEWRLKGSGSDTGDHPRQTVVPLTSLSTLDSAESGRERASPTGGCSGEAEEVVTSTEGFTASSVACDFEEVSSSVAVVTDRESVA